MATHESKATGDSGQQQPPVQSAVATGEPTSTVKESNRGNTPGGSRSGPTELPGQFGRYRVIKKLGGGGMGTVYLVENTELERLEALKVPHFTDGDDPQVRERFLREAKSAAKLDHPNLCEIYSSGVQDGIYYMTMRFLQGKPLSDSAGKARTARKAVEIVTKLAQALDSAHGIGVIHRDLKPSNVMMVAGVGPVVMDFGLAKQVQRPDQKLTQTGSVMGTPAYMPPEQVNGELERMGPATDVYSLGVMLYELLTGRLPFAGTMAQVFAQILYVEPPMPSELVPGLSPALDGICRKAMAKEPTERFPSMKAFAVALLDYRNSTPTAEGGYNLMPTAPDRAAVFDAATVPPRGRPAGTSDVFQVATVPPQARGLVPPTPRGGQAPTEYLPADGARKTNKKADATTDDDGTSQSPTVVVLAISLIFALMTIAIGGVLWAAGVFRVRTADGTLVVEVNEPNPDVYVDGEKVTVAWQNGGVRAEVAVKPGTRKVELKKDGFRAYGGEVTLEDHGRTRLLARLEPNPPKTSQVASAVDAAQHKQGENRGPAGGPPVNPQESSLRSTTPPTTAHIPGDAVASVPIVGKPETGIPANSRRRVRPDLNAIRGADVDRGKSLRASSDPAEIAEIVGEVAPGFTAKTPVIPGGVALSAEHFGRKRVLSTHPLDPRTPCMLTSTIDVPKNTETLLTFDVSHSAAGDWQVVVLANGERLYDAPVGPTTARDGWLAVSVDLTRFAGQSVVLELQNKATGYSHEWAWWDKVRITARKTEQSGESQPNAGAEKAPEPRWAYLSDLDETEWSGHADFGKNGSSKTAPITVNGIKFHKGLWTHPVDRGSASVKYRLAGLGATAFVTGVAINDTAHPTIATSLTFQVLGDGQILWTSVPTREKGRMQECQISVKDVRVLELRVNCPGWYDSAHAVWLDPYLWLSGPGEGALHAETPKTQAASNGLPAQPVAALDLLPAGSVWKGTRSYRRGAYAGNTVSYELYVQERSGTTFKGYKIDNGKNRLEIEGEIDGGTVAWSEILATDRKVHFRAQGELKANEIVFNFQGDRNFTVGDGSVKRE
jgi:hypothetical protein